MFTNLERIEDRLELFACKSFFKVLISCINILDGNMIHGICLMIF